MELATFGLLDIKICGNPGSGNGMWFSGCERGGSALGGTMGGKSLSKDQTKADVETQVW